LIREHGDALEADLQRHYGIDLLDVYRGRLSLRRLRVLLRGLPPDCRTLRAISDVDEALDQWSLPVALLGRVLDELAALRWEFEAVHGDKRRLRDPPKSVLPDVQPEERDESARVIPIVSPHRLGEFMTDIEGEPRGD